MTRGPTVDLGAVEVVQVRRRGKGCLSYLVGSGGGSLRRRPLGRGRPLPGRGREGGWRITRVFDTHLHADHVSGARALAVTAGASLHLNPADAYEFDFEPLGDGDRFELGGAVLFEVTAVSTPGHTRGSTVYDVGGRAVLTGDTLFVDGVGRPDLAERAEEFARELHRSLHAQVLTRPDDTLVLPGHYGGAVGVRPSVPVAAALGDLRRTLEPLSWDEEAFVEWAAHLGHAAAAPLRRDHRRQHRPSHRRSRGLPAARGGTEPLRGVEGRARASTVAAAREESVMELPAEAVDDLVPQAVAAGGRPGPGRRAHAGGGPRAPGGGAGPALGGHQGPRAGGVQAGGLGARRHRIEHPAEAAADGYALAEVERLLMKLA